jgi:hypothetical protein
MSPNLRWRGMNKLNLSSSGLLVQMTKDDPKLELSAPQ